MRWLLTKMKLSRPDQRKNPLKYVQFLRVVIIIVNIAQKSNAMDVSLSLLMKNSFQMWRWRMLSSRYSGFKMPNKFNKDSSRQDCLIAILSHQTGRALESRSMIALNFSSSLKFWLKIMLGTVPNARILYLPRNKCKSTRLPRYSLWHWKDLSASSTSLKSIQCNICYI
jgi:hypothetical protein